MVDLIFKVNWSKSNTKWTPILTFHLAYKTLVHFSWYIKSTGIVNLIICRSRELFSISNKLILWYFGQEPGLMLHYSIFKNFLNNFLREAGHITKSCDHQINEAQIYTPWNEFCLLIKSRFETQRHIRILLSIFFRDFIGA